MAAASGSYYDQFPRVDVENIPCYPYWFFPRLFKKARAKGKVLMWEIGFDGQNLIKRHGQLGGKIQDDLKAVLLNSSGKDIISQALQECRKAFNDKIDDNYVYSPEVALNTDFFSPMLAKNVEDYGFERIQYPVGVQLKIDGKRCITKIAPDGSVDMDSRTGKEQKHLDALREELRNFFTCLPQGVYLDGELCHRSGGRIGTVSITQSKHVAHVDEKSLVYFIFDLFDGKVNSYMVRHQCLLDAYNKYVSIGGIPNYFVVLDCQIKQCWEEVQEYYLQAVNNKEEGIMIKDLQSKYVCGRTSAILKYKFTKEEEGMIIGLYGGEGKHLGCAILTCVTSQGVKFNVVPAEPFETRRMWLSNPTMVLGLLYTIRYSEKSVDGVPQHPVGLRFRVDL